MVNDDGWKETFDVVRRLLMRIEIETLKRLEARPIALFGTPPVARLSLKATVNP